ncbi:MULTISPECIES: peptidylprolyl isomerase [Xanthomarina]|jgi:parvulin-like peptidyl-prolyl isomerase|uniref:Periplasmic chaperone PpiD n=1 Tax=Xanthomarina gelatinilytica TaxID=1137281 RepID=M7MKZ4_9FLAO|nr:MULTISPECIES: SurA N-terminal domain-containing protein [Xanthomarina]EMQ95565.1 Peptidyl-prolyl cis-trans isomerase [Xanthomarina gelatinilytica]MAL23179.1 peptidylprolyl isomerase [Xanthomarina sp.]MBF60624.1 peptidylprolyl isomerase [Xanthomarina sp.]
MAVLNKIRQRGLFLIIVIALALFSFVIGDLFRNTDALVGKSQNIVATINGKDISREDFMQKVEVAQRQLGPNGTNTQAMNRVWEQEVRQAVLETQFEELGMTVEKDQMRDLLRTNLANSPEFQNEAGLFDENKLNEYIANLKETSAVAYAQWVDYENSIGVNALQQDYFNMVKAGMTGTLAEGKLEHMLESETIDIKYVQIPYTSIPDSTVSVSKSEISSYINKHKKQYEVEATRDIRYVEFKEAATVEDENNIKQDLANLLKDQVVYNEVTKNNDTIKGFATVTNHKVFVNSNSDIKFEDRFKFKSDLPASVADTIFNMNVGDVYGPYKDGNYFKLTKVIAAIQMPDSVKARHILIPYVGAASAQPDVTQSKEQAKKTADSLLSVLKKDNSKFGEFVSTYSSDQGSVANGGSYDYFTYNTMVPEFRDYVFQNNVGDMDVVETVYGYHIIEVEGQKNKQRAIKVATVAREIEPSETTINQVFRDASNFEIAIEKGDFEAVAKEKDLAVRPVNGIKVLDENIPGLGNQRAMVRWAFEEGTEVGDYKRFNLNGGYAIVQVTATNAAGLMNTEQASVTALPAIRKEKKAALIKDRISATTVEDVAAAENQTVKTALAINMKNPTISGAGKEGLVVGTAFGLKEGETSKLIEGEKGVYMVQVTKKTPAPELDNYQGFANQVGTSKMNNVNTKLYNALKEASDIEDNRANTVQ